MSSLFLLDSIGDKKKKLRKKKNQKLPDAPLDPTDENHFKGRKRRAELLQEDGKVARKELSREGKSFLAFFIFYFFSSSFILCCTSKEVPEREKDSADQSRGCWYERVPLTFNFPLHPVPHFSITTQPTI